MLLKLILIDNVRVVFLSFTFRESITIIEIGKLTVFSTVYNEQGER